MRQRVPAPPILGGILAMPLKKLRLCTGNKADVTKGDKSTQTMKTKHIRCQSYMLKEGVRL